MQSPTFSKIAHLAILTACVTTLSAQKSPFTPEKLWELQRLESPDISPDGKSIIYTRWTPNNTQNRWDATIWQMGANGENASQLTQGRDAQWSPDGLWIAYLANMDGKTQLLARTVKSGDVVQLTRGQESPERFRWSPDSKLLAFTQLVPDSAQSPLVAIKRARRQLFVVAVDGGTPKQVTKGKMEVGTNDAGIAAPTSFNWFPDNRNIAFDGNDSPTANIEYLSSSIFFVDIETTIVDRLTGLAGFWHSPVISPDGRWVAYTGFSDDGSSYRTEDLYIMGPDGKNTRQLTTGLERDPIGVVWAPDNLSIWFTAEDKGSVNVFSASITASAKPATNGAHALVLGALSSKDGGFGVAVRSGLTAPSEIVRFAIRKPTELKAITSVNAALVGQTIWGEVEEITFRNSGATLQGWLLRPPGFQLSRRYPLMVEIHDGPHAMFSAAFDPTASALTGAGYLVLRINARGSSGFGNTTGGGLSAGFPGIEVDDILAGIRSVTENGGVDTTRIYLDGCGAGGMTALQTLTRVAPFAAATLRCTGGDWLPLTGATVVRSFDDPFFSRPFRQDPLVWAEHAPLRFASSIRTPILIMAGKCDLEAPFAMGRALHSALVLRRVEAVLMPFEDECRGTTSRPANWIATIRARLAWYGAPAHKS